MPIIIKSGNDELGCIKLDVSEEGTDRDESLEILNELTKCLEEFADGLKAKKNQANAKIDDSEDQDDSLDFDFESVTIDISDESEGDPAEALRDEIDWLQEKISRLEKENSELKGKLKDKERRIMDLNSKYLNVKSALFREHERSAASKNLNEANQKNSQLSKDLARAKKKIIVLNETIDNLLNQIQEFGDTDQEIPAEDDE